MPIQRAGFVRPCKRRLQYDPVRDIVHVQCSNTNSSTCSTTVVVAAEPEKSDELGLQYFSRIYVCELYAYTM